MRINSSRTSYQGPERQSSIRFFAIQIQANIGQDLEKVSEVLPVSS